MTILEVHCVIFHRMPTEEDMRTLPTYDLTTEDPWSPISHRTQEFDATKCMLPTTLRRSITGRRDLTLTILEKWKTHLYIHNENVLRKTLDATTQLAVTEQVETSTPALKYKKRRLYQFKHRRLDETVFTDTLVVSGDKLSVIGFSYFQVYRTSRSKFVKAYPTKKKSDAIHTLKKFFTEIGTPSKLMHDLAGEENSDEWTRLCHDIKHLCLQHRSEAYHQHQNAAEYAIDYVKRSTHRFLHLSGAPLCYWCYANELGVDIYNRTALESLNWRTTHELCLGDTPDISPFYQFEFFQKVR